MPYLLLPMARWIVALFRHLAGHDLNWILRSLPPRTPAEEALVQIWAEVLSVDQVGIHDNFLELGGHSLLATQIISRVLNTFHVEVPMRSLLETPTVASMAVAIVQHLAGKAEAEEMAHMLAHIESLSDEEAQRLVTQAMQGKGSLNAQ